MRPVDALYENGVLRPVSPLPLKAGARVGLIVVQRSDPSRWNLSRHLVDHDEDSALAEAGLAEWADTLDAEDAGKRGEIWWADLGAYRTQEQTGRRPVVIWQSDALTRTLQSVLVVPLTTNLDRARLAGTAFVASTATALPTDSVALAFQMRAIPKACLRSRIGALTDEEIGELELATDEAVGRAEPG